MTGPAAEPRPARLPALTGQPHTRATVPRAIALALLATPASFAAISLYDVIAARAMARGAFFKITQLPRHVDSLWPSPILATDHVLPDENVRRS